MIGRKLASFLRSKVYYFSIETRQVIRDIVQIQILDVRLGTKANTDEPLRQTVIRQNIVGRKVLARAATTLRRLAGKFKVSSFDGN